MEIADFSQPIRQSSKGIIIIFAFNVFKFFKRFFVIFIAFGLSLVKNNSFVKLSPSAIILIIAGILAVLLIIAILKYLNFKFHLNKDDFYLSTGIINKDNTIIPKSKIQNVYIKQNFLQQLINVVSLNIETAGDKKSEIEISALDKPTALQLKNKLFNKVSSKEELTEAIEVNKVFFRISLKRLVLEGISQNHFKSFAIIASFVFGLYYEFKDYLKSFRIKEHIEKVVDLDDESLFNLVFINLAIIIIGFLFSLLFSVVKTCIINFNLQVVENQKTIEINKGLFNKVSLSLTPSRIQNIVIKTNRIKQYLGLHTLYVKQAMVNIKQRKNFAIIALEKAQVNHLVNSLLVDYTDDLEAFKPRLYYKRILTYKMLVIITVITIIGLFIIGNMMWWFTLLFIVIGNLYNYFRFKKAYYKIDDQFVTIGSGAVNTKTDILETHKIQAIKLKQNIFQKRKKIASVAILTASKAVIIPYISEKDAKTIYDFLLFKVESSRKDWM